MKTTKLTLRRHIKSLSACLFSAAVLLSGVTAHAAVIRDIADSSGFAVQSIRNMAERGIISGDGTGNFHPRELMTRSEMVKMLVLSLGLDTEAVPEKPTFDDVPKSHWAYRYVEAAYKEGIVSGVAPRLFAPDEKCTREQMAKMFINGMKPAQTGLSIESIEQSGTELFTDYENISPWAKNTVNLAVYCGLMKGTGSKTFSPGQYVTKEQMAVVADRFMTDSDKIQEALDAISNIQVTGGQGDLFFAFSKSVEGLGVKHMTGQRAPEYGGYELKKGANVQSESHRRWTYVAGEHMTAKVGFFPNYGGESEISFSFIFSDGKDRILNCKKTIRISDHEPFVHYVMPLNANQIKVRFSEGVVVESAENPHYYTLSDENGKPIPIGNITMANTGSTPYAIINLSEPLTKRTTVNVHIKEGIEENLYQRQYLSYSSLITVDDGTPPDIERVTATDDGKYITSVTLMFTEPVASGTVMVGNVPVGAAKGEITTISGLKLDGALSHHVKVTNISDGVNTDTSSTLMGLARIYAP